MAESKKRGRPKKVRPEAIEEAQIEETMVEEEPQPVDSGQDEAFGVDDNTSKMASSNEEFIGNLGTGGNYNPFGEDVIEREYATPKTAEGLTEDIPEPDFSSNPSFEDLMNESVAEPEPEPSPFDNPNPAVNDLPPQEKQYACEQMVDTVLDVYDSLHLIAQKFVQFSEDDLNELIINDEVDPETLIPTEHGDISLQQFVQSYNEQAKEVMTYDRAFAQKVRPAMVRVFMKKGWAMTDEQYLLFAFGKDLLTKTTQFIGLKKSISTTMNLLKEMHLENRKQKSSRPSPQREPSYQRDNEVDFEFQTSPDQTVQDAQPLNFENEQDEMVGVKQKTSYQEFKPPKETVHPPLMQEEMDKANAEVDKANNKIEE